MIIKKWCLNKVKPLLNEKNGNNCRTNRFTGKKEVGDIVAFRYARNNLVAPNFSVRSLFSSDLNRSATKLKKEGGN